MVRFSDKGKGYHGDPQGHSENARGIKHGLAGYDERKRAEFEYLQRKYFHSGRQTPREIKALHKRRLAYERRYGESAVTGIGRED